MKSLITYASKSGAARECSLQFNKTHNKLGDLTWQNLFRNLKNGTPGK